MVLWSLSDVLIQKLLLEANNILGLIKNNLIQIDYYFVPYASIEDIPPFSGLSRRGASSIAPHQVVKNSVTAKGRLHFENNKLLPESRHIYEV